MTTQDELTALLEEAMNKLREASNSLKKSASPKEPDGIIGLRFVAEIISEDWPLMADACDEYASQWENDRESLAALGRSFDRERERRIAAEKELSDIRAELLNFELNGSNAPAQIRGIYADFDETFKKLRDVSAQSKQLIKAIGAKTFEEALELIAALKREVAIWKGIAHDNNQLWLSAARRADDLEGKFVRSSKESGDSDLTTLKKLADLLFTLDQFEAWEKAVLISQRWEADRAILKLARELLERYEWQEDLHTGAQVCPVCRGGRPHHRKDCDIPTILGRNKP